MFKPSKIVAFQQMSSSHSRDTLQQMVQHCGILQHTATRCNTLQHPNINYCQVLTANCMALTVCVSLLQFFFWPFFWPMCWVGVWWLDGEERGVRGLRATYETHAAGQTSNQCKRKSVREVFACESGYVWLLPANVEQQRECVHQSVC